MWSLVGCLSPMPTRYLLLPPGKLPDMKSTWSPGAISNREATGSLSHELWKVPHGPRNSAAPSRPPPGLTHTKPPPSAPSSSTWGGNSLGLGQSWSSSYTSGNTACRTPPRFPGAILDLFPSDETGLPHPHTIHAPPVILKVGLVKISQYGIIFWKN
jgi:hypothetical protein